MRNLSPSSSGLTIIEVLAALLVLSMGAYTLLAASNQALRLGRDANSEAWEIAATEDLRALRRAYARKHEGTISQTHGQDVPECLLSGCTSAELATFLEGAQE